MKAGGEMKIVTLLLIAAVFASAAVPSHAGDYPFACRDFAGFARGDLQQPARPPCLDNLFDRGAIEMCQPLMDIYQLQVRSYVECLKSENSAIIDTFNAAAKQFNCAQNRMAC
jgi:hypothetical protein